MNFWQRVRGTTEALFQLGKGGPNWKGAASAAIEARNAADSAYAIVRGLTPAAANDFTTKAYVDANASGGGFGAASSYGAASARPGASGTGRFYFCTDSDLPVMYFDDPVSAAWKQFCGTQYVPAPAAIGAYTKSTNTVLQQYADAIRASLLVDTVSKTETALIAGTLTSTATWIVNFVGLSSSIQNRQYSGVGPCVTTGTNNGVSTGKGLSYFTGISATGGYGWHQEAFTVAGARSAANAETGTQNVGLVRARLLADGTNLHYQISQQGGGFTDIYCEATPASLTHYGFYIGNGFSSGNGWCQAIVLRNDLTALEVPQQTITNVTKANPAVATVADTSKMKDGDLVAVHGVTGTGNFAALVNSGTTTTTINTAASVAWLIQVVNATTFKLLGCDTSGSTGVYSANGTATVINR